MSNITANKFNNIREGQFGKAPAYRALEFFIGGAVCVGSDGYLRKAADTAGFVTAGIVSGGTGPAGSTDNSLGSDGDIDIEFRKGCDVWLNAQGFTPAITDFNTKVYWYDDQTVAKAGTTTNDILAGRIVDFSGTTVLVRLATPGEMDDLAGIAALTENGGAIGGTNDGNLPAFIANLTENAGAIGGTNDGDLPDLTATYVARTGDGATTLGTANGAYEDQNDAVTATDGTTPGAAALKSDVDARLVSIGNNMQEIQTVIAQLAADNVNLRAAIRENAAKINAINTATTAQIRELADKVNEIVNA